MFSKLFKIVLIAVILLMTNNIFAEESKDPYLWLENIDGEKALNWVKAQNKKTLDVLQKQPLYSKIYNKILEIYNSKDRIAIPTFRDKYVYNFWKDAKNERGLWRRTTLKEYRKKNPKWESILDIDALSKKEHKKWVFKGASFLYPDYKLCMVRLSPGGGDAVVMREFNVETKQFVKNGFYLPKAKGGVSWIDKNTLIVSTDFGKGTKTSSGYPRITKIWKRGTSLKQAKTIYEGKKTDVEVSGYVINTPERQYQFVNRGITFYTSNVFAIENSKLIKLGIPDDADFQGIKKNQMIVSLKSDWKVNGKIYKQGALISIDYDKLLKGIKDIRLIFQPDAKSSITTVASTKNLLILNVLDNVRSKIYEVSLKNGKWIKKKVKAPDFGSIGIVSTDRNSDRYFFTFTNFLVPTSLYLVSNNKIEKLKSLPAFFDASKYKVEQFESTSKDGTKIPYFVIHRKNMKLNGQNPTLLYGYGGFEVSLKPFYSAITGTAWLENGGTFVLANIRGGGEFGPKWHKAGLKEHRQRVFDDFISVAEDLIHRKITSPRHLGIWGGSNGGLLVGAVFTQRPDLFNAVVCQVPLLDMKRYNKLLAGASWMGEYGNPDKPEEWAYIKKYSPYQNVFANKKYPKVFFLTSTRDDRVHPGHARKMAAKMEGQGHKVYFFEDTEGGHAGASTNKQHTLMRSLIFTYCLMQLK